MPRHYANIYSYCISLPWEGPPSERAEENRQEKQHVYGVSSHLPMVHVVCAVRLLNSEIEAKLLQSQGTVGVSPDSLLRCRDVFRLMLW